MFTDMAGFSRKMGDSERLTLKILGDHNRIIRFLVRKHHGKIIKSTGDGFLLDFDSAVEAVLCAIEAQERFQRYNLNKPECEQIVVRVGIHLGEVKIVDSDLFGDEVNIAARIQTLAEPGGICISREVYDHVKSKLSIVAMNLGPQELKNIRHKVEIYKVLVRALGQEAIEIPSVETAPVSLPEKNLAAQANRNGSQQNHHLWDLLSRIAPFKKTKVVPVGNAMPVRRVQVEPASRTKHGWNARLLRRAIPVMVLSLILPMLWMVLDSNSNSFTASLASMTRGFSAPSYANTHSLSRDTSNKTIAVLYFENRTKDLRDNWMTVGLADMLITELESTPCCTGRILGRTRIIDVLKRMSKENVQAMDLSLARIVAEKADADLMLLGSFAREGETIRIDTQLYDVRKGEMLLAEKAKGESVFNMVEELSSRLNQTLPSVMQTR
jgi:class 3 adenylate cyclase/TolB-like protein